MKSLVFLSACGIASTICCSQAYSQETPISIANKEQKDIETITVTGELIERPIYKTANSAEIFDEEILEILH